jgi:hypothetical protein
MEASSQPNEVQGLLEAISRTPAEVARLLEQMPVDRVRVRPTPEEFSAVETVCHLRDIETEGYAERIGAILREVNPGLADVDGARLAIERDYNSQEIEPALDEFRDTRKRNVELLRTASVTDLDRKGTLEGVGEITLRELIAMMSEHDESHLEEMRRLVRLLLQPMSPP